MPCWVEHVCDAACILLTISGLPFARQKMPFRPAKQCLLQPERCPFAMRSGTTPGTAYGFFTFHSYLFTPSHVDF